MMGLERSGLDETVNLTNVGTHASPTHGLRRQDGMRRADCAQNDGGVQALTTSQGAGPTARKR